jgi:aspartate aminotransferase
MSISKQIEQIMEQSSWIRRMFEAGAELKAQHGAENVYDFSIGNPNVAPPEQFKSTLAELVRTSVPADHGYMANVGYPEVRKTVADYITQEHEVSLSINS